MLQSAPQRYYVGAGQNGAIWIGVGPGLIRWDATQSKLTHFNFALKRAPEFSWENVVNMYEDSHGVIWIGTYYGFARFDPSENNFEFHRHEAGRFGCIKLIRFSFTVNDNFFLFFSTNIL